VIARVLGYAGLLREPAFRRLWVAQSISQVGSQVTVLALPLVAILVLGASPFEVALLGAVEFLPFLLFTLPAGAWVDRLAKQSVMVVADLGRMVILGAIPLAYVLDVLALWQVYLVGFLAGTLTVFFDISYQAIVPELVRRDRLQEGNSRLEVSRSAATVLGPAIAGLLVALVRAPLAILVDALSYLGSAAFLVGLRPRFAAARPPAATGSATGLRHEILEGLRFYRQSPLLLACSAAIVGLNLGGQIGGSIVLVFLVRELGLTPQAIGLAMSIGSVGLLTGAATGSAFGKRVGVGPTLIVASALSAAASLLLVVASPDTAFALLVVSGLVQGYAVMLININGVSLRQALTPDHLQGRVNATGRWINWSVIPPGALLGGAIATIVGLRFTVAFGALVGLVVVPWLLVSPLRRLHDLPRPFEIEAPPYSEPPEVIMPT
jgi:Na+/melibiose symporter-like transporter